VRPVADEVPAAEDGVDLEALDLGESRLERGQVRMDVGDDGDALQFAEGSLSGSNSATSLRTRWSRSSRIRRTSMR
jgi:hypothetical protein